MKNYLAFALLFATVATPALMSARAHAAFTGVNGVQVAEAGQGAAGTAQSSGAQGQDEGSDMDDEGDDASGSDKGGSAQNDDGGGSAGSSGDAGSSGKGGGQRFQAMKAKVLQGLDNRIAKVQALQSCVQSSTDRQSLRACLPARGSRGGGQSGGGDSGN